MPKMATALPTPGASEFAGGWRVLLASFLGIGIGASSIYFYSLGVFINLWRRPMDGGGAKRRWARWSVPAVPR